MSKFNVKTARPAVSSPVHAEQPAANVHGLAGYGRDEKSELFLLAVALMNVGKDTFYERGDARTDRYRELVGKVAPNDPEWLAGFLPWLRTDGLLRSAPLVGAAEMVAARRGLSDEGRPAGRAVDGVLQRADEPGEILAYYTGRYGMALPKPLKWGAAQAVLRLYDEYALGAWDKEDAAFRFARVLDLVHPATDKEWQRALFDYAHAVMRGRRPELAPELTMLRARAELTALPVPERRAALLADGGTDRVRKAGMSWKSVAAWLHGPLDADVWSALVPTLGYQALLSNLRNFDDAGVSDEVAERVAKRLTDPERVGKSKLFPFYFYAAYRAVRSLRWGYTLEKALQASLANIPALPGRTLVLVDQSPSMFPGYWFSSRQQHKEISNADLSKLFGGAVALRAADATLVGFGQQNYRVNFRKGDALLKLIECFRVEDGTDTFGAAADHFDRHDRVVIVTDEQNNGRRYTSIDEVVPKHVPVYTWNIGGNPVGATASGLGTRHTFGGLNDAGFRTVSMIEAGRDARWPWLEPTD